MEERKLLPELVNKFKIQIAGHNQASIFFDEIEKLIFKYEKLQLEFEQFKRMSNEGDAWFQEIFNSSSEAIIIHDALDGRIIDINSHAVKMYGYQDRSEMLNLKVSDISSQKDNFNDENIRFILKQTIEEGPQQFIWQAKRKNQINFWTEVSLKCTKIGGVDQVLAIVKDIDQRKKTEDALFESERFLKETQEIARLGTYVFDISTSSWRCSHVLDEIFGISTDFEKNISNWVSLVHPDHAAEMATYFTEEVLTKHNSFDKEYKIIRKNDGSERWIHGLGKIIFNKDGKPFQLIGTIRDITERKITEEVLKQTEARQSTMIANISDVISIIDEQGIIKYKSPNIEKLFGWKPEELHLQSIWKFVHPEDFPETKAMFEEQIKNEETVKQAECRFMCKNGDYRLIEYTAIALLKNPYIKGILVNYHDITEKKKATEALQIEQRFSKTILDSLPGIFYLYSYPELRLKIWNKNHELLLGYTSDEIKNFHIMDWHLPENKEAVQAAVDYVMISGLNTLEATLIAKDGRQIPFLLTGSKFEAGDKRYLMGVGIDITVQKENEVMLQRKTEEIEVQNEEYLQLNEELIQTNNELLTAKERAEESDRLKTAFLQNMSHEIRTPMNAIMGFSELMSGAYNNKEKLEYFSQIINRRCRDLLAIINDILDIAKIESGQLAILNEKCELSTLFAELKVFYCEYQKRLKKEHIGFELTVTEELKNNPILIDVIKLRQILINLIGNAFKYTDKGEIKCHCKLENNQLIFSVSDTGIGIPPGKHQYIFERFVQAHQDNRIIGGTGLGLSIVKGLLNLLNGKIWLNSLPGNGSTFYFSIPYVAYQNKRQKFENDIPYLSEIRFNGLSVLIVEDEIYNTVYLEEILSDYQLKILSSAYGQEAINLARQHNFDMILMDIRLPDMSGYEVTRQIKEFKPDVKIIALTAYAAPEDKEKAINAGCIDYLSKPVKKEDLITMMSRYLK